MNEPLSSNLVAELLADAKEIEDAIPTLIHPGIVARLRPYISHLRASADEIGRLTADVQRLQKELDGYRAWERSINEALNSGDGTYRP